MKRKYFLVVLFLILVMFLVGCSGGIPTTPGTTSEDETNVKSVIYEYFLAVSYQNWSKAKSYCVYGSDRYYATAAMEQFANDLFQYGGGTISCVVDISNVSISGSLAKAYISLDIIFGFGGYYDTESVSAYYYLQKVGNSWKIYAP